MASVSGTTGIDTLQGRNEGDTIRGELKASEAVTGDDTLYRGPSADSTGAGNDTDVRCRRFHLRLKQDHLRLKH